MDVLTTGDEHRLGVMRCAIGISFLMFAVQMLRGGEATIATAHIVPTA